MHWLQWWWFNTVRMVVFPQRARYSMRSNRNGLLLIGLVISMALIFCHRLDNELDHRHVDNDVSDYSSAVDIFHTWNLNCGRLTLSACSLIA